MQRVISRVRYTKTTTAISRQIVHQTCNYEEKENSRWRELYILRLFKCFAREKRMRPRQRTRTFLPS